MNIFYDKKYHNLTVFWEFTFLQKIYIFLKIRIILSKKISEILLKFKFVNFDGEYLWHFFVSNISNLGIYDFFHLILPIISAFLQFVFTFLRLYFEIWVWIRDFKNSWIIEFVNSILFVAKFTKKTTKNLYVKFFLQKNMNNQNWPKLVSEVIMTIMTTWNYVLRDFLAICQRKKISKSFFFCEITCFFVANFTNFVFYSEIRRHYN